MCGGWAERLLPLDRCNELAGREHRGRTYCPQRPTGPRLPHIIVMGCAA